MTLRVVLVRGTAAASATGDTRASARRRARGVAHLHKLRQREWGCATAAYLGNTKHDIHATSPDRQPYIQPRAMRRDSEVPPHPE